MSAPPNQHWVPEAFPLKCGPAQSRLLSQTKTLLRTYLAVVDPLLPVEVADPFLAESEVSAAASARDAISTSESNVDCAMYRTARPRTNVLGSGTRAGQSLRYETFVITPANVRD